MCNMLCHTRGIPDIYVCPDCVWMDYGVVYSRWFVVNFDRNCLNCIRFLYWFYLFFNVVCGVCAFRGKNPLTEDPILWESFFFIFKSARLTLSAEFYCTEQYYILSATVLVPHNNYYYCRFHCVRAFRNNFHFRFEPIG